jgi:hypothetical protein
VENLHPILKVYPAMLAAASKWVPSHGQSGSIGQLGYRMKMDKFDLPEDRVPKNHIILYIIIIFPLICAILGFWTERIDHYQKPPEAKDSATTPHFFSVGQSGAVRDTTLEAFAGDCPGLQHVSIDHKRLKLQDNH